MSGTLTLAQNVELKVYVGQQGRTNGGDAWNGGGHMHASSHNGYLACGGGGATDISLQGSSAWKTDAHLYSRIIVAGGGGGAVYWKEGETIDGHNGGAGGAWNGGNGAGSDPGHGATLDGIGANGAMLQDAVNAGFGYGGSMDYDHTPTWHYEAAGAGGGGWYGGGCAGFASMNGSGGGGSSYAWSTEQNLHQKYPTSTYKPSTNYYLSNVSAESSVRTGHGFARITYTRF